MTFDPDILLIATFAATFAVSVIAALISFSQRWSTPSRAILAMFFAVFAISELDTVLTALTSEIPQTIRDATALLSLIANFCVLPVFLLYVRELTLNQDPSDGKRSVALHFALPAAVTVFAVLVMALPAASREIWHTGASAQAPTPGLGFLRYGFTLLTIALVLQWVLYVFWVIRLQMKHIAMLKQHFSSTEGLELRWIVILAGAMGTYILQTFFGELLIAFGSQDPTGPLLESLWVLVVIVSIALWGLRPSKELDGVAADLEVLEERFGKKYEKSALGSDQSERIARKLVHAMVEERLYRDPNLTLSSLSTHLGVSLNYVSQTLNQHLRQSFFEFVNSCRVKEAIPLVEEGASTVLAIAYEVGFNSRSSFYTAFKRETGMTPTSYKNAVAKSTTSHATGPIAKATKP